jgi:hypothetical protein
LQLIVWIELFNSLKRCQETIKHTQKKEKRKKKKEKEKEKEKNSSKSRMESLAK